MTHDWFSHSTRATTNPILPMGARRPRARARLPPGDSDRKAISRTADLAPTFGDSLRSRARRNISQHEHRVGTRRRRYGVHERSRQRVKRDLNIRPACCSRRLKVRAEPSEPRLSAASEPGRSDERRSGPGMRRRRFRTTGPSARIFYPLAAREHNLFVDAFRHRRRHG